MKPDMFELFAHLLCHSRKADKKPLRVRQLRARLANRFSVLVIQKRKINVNPDRLERAVVALYQRIKERLGGGDVLAARSVGHLGR